MPRPRKGGLFSLGAVGRIGGHRRGWTAPTPMFTTMPIAQVRHRGIIPVGMSFLSDWLAYTWADATSKELWASVTVAPNVDLVLILYDDYVSFDSITIPAGETFATKPLTGDPIDKHSLILALTYVGDGVAKDLEITLAGSVKLG